jgi:hypothetical protein
MNTDFDFSNYESSILELRLAKIDQKTDVQATRFKIVY